MISSKLSRVELRIGDLVVHESERSTLLEIERLLAEDGRRAIIFANFEVRSQQIDLLVALDEVVLVIEAKHSNRPVRGTENGDWQVRLASGRWKNFRNPYKQALEAALALKNSVDTFSGEGAPYVDAALVFVPNIPLGSYVFEGNHKVSVIELDGLKTTLDRRRAGGWSVDRWREFADHLRLKNASSVDAACDPVFADAEDRLQNYKTMFHQTYGEGDALVPFECRSGGKSIASADVVRLALEQHGGLLLQGPSGCGKSMLAAECGVAFSDLGGIAICVQGKDFVGNVKKLLDCEAALLGARSASQLLRDARQLGRSIMFIVDGYNECREDLQGRLTRRVAALAEKFEGGILVTSQVPLVRGNLLDLRHVNVPPPSNETKFEIARAVSRKTDSIAHLLDAVSSSLEARLVGEVGATATQGISRYALFDCFARIRLGRAASDGIRVLSKVAAWLFRRLTFSMSIRDFDRLVDGCSMSAEFRRLILNKGLLTQRGDRVSFAHEMFLDAFAAEAVVRQAAGGSASILEALSTPVHAARKDLIIGAIDDDSTLERLLPMLEDQTSIRACLDGRCGSEAKDWAEEHCRQLWARLQDEVSNVRFEASAETYLKVKFAESTLEHWGPSDRTLLSVLPERLARGLHVEDAFEATGLLDRRIADETLQLSKATGVSAPRLRSDFFAASYVFAQQSSGAPGISMICSDLNSGVFRLQHGSIGRPDKLQLNSILREFVGKELSPGQLYLFLNLMDLGGVPASFLVQAIKDHWETAPYHLQLGLMDAAGSSDVAVATLRGTATNDADRMRLVETIKGLLPKCNPFVASSAVDALKSLGALDEEVTQYQMNVREMVKYCLDQPIDSKRQAEAYAIYAAQFDDHPYSEAYSEVLAGLPPGDRKTLLKMAASGVEEPSFFVGPLLQELATFDDQDIGDIFKRWTIPPPRNNRNFPQSDIERFVLAHVLLGKLRCPLAAHRVPDDDPAVTALSSCGAILYWANRTDLAEKVKMDACKHVFAILKQQGEGAALDVLRECEDVPTFKFGKLTGDGSTVLSVVTHFPAEAVDISRSALQEPARLVSYFRGHSGSYRERIVAFGIGILERYGSMSDRSLLRRYASCREVGRLAMSVLMEIEKRSITK